MRVLDIGGGSEVHAQWLVADGYEVEVVDPMPLHFELAPRAEGATARLGDARELLENSSHVLGYAAGRSP